tara:strand:- start:598 stop:957 length:360 start_codon:yes stop_codon:yes gene_type:complete
MKRYIHDKFLDHNPTHLATILGADFYEHPVFGGDVGAVIIKDGRAGQTDLYDMPEHSEAIYWINALAVSTMPETRYQVVEISSNGGRVVSDGGLDRQGAIDAVRELENHGIDAMIEVEL